MKKRIIAGMLSFTLMLSILLSGCSSMTAQTKDLMEDVTADTINNDTDLTGNDSEAIAKFAVSLFQNSTPAAENTLISPLSVLYALAMTANGAKEETLVQMEDVFGLPKSELNSYLHAYLENLPSDNKYKVSIANSLWFKDDENLTVEPNFLQTNADYYGASVYKAAFDAGTLRDINNWVSDNTEGMIENILDEIPDLAIMYLINALVFDAEWENIYTDDQIQNGIFTLESGEIRDAEMMYGSENQYLDDGNATGFVKYYADRKYAFAALLPDESISVADYIASLTENDLMNTLSNVQNVEVKTAIPKFESEYEVDMAEILNSMGMTDAFDPESADFTGLGQSTTGNIYISRVLHKTYIAVDEKGTKAGAATVVEMSTESAQQTEIKTVYLDRPFVYMLIDCETNLPLFIGTMMDTAG